VTLYLIGGSRRVTKCDEEGGVNFFPKIAYGRLQSIDKDLSNSQVNAELLIDDVTLFVPCVHC